MQQLRYGKPFASFRISPRRKALPIVSQCSCMSKFHAKVNSGAKTCLKPSFSEFYLIEFFFMFNCWTVLFEIGKVLRLEPRLYFGFYSGIYSSKFSAGSNQSTQENR